MWAPFSLVRQSYYIRVFSLAANIKVYKLAEAIHTAPDLVSGEPDMDDNQSILLTDTSTHRQLPQHEELFAVEGGDSDEDEVVASHDGVVQGDAAEEDWDKVNDDEIEEGDSDRQVLMGNTNARRSWADLASLGEEPVQNGAPRPSREGLSAKAGIILVC
jgi:hypothetical protein